MKISKKKQKFNWIRGLEKTSCCLVFSSLMLLCFSGPLWGEPVKGLFGMSALRNDNPVDYISLLEKSGATAVFVPPDRKTIAWFKKEGMKVYVSLNVFGGAQAWSKYPDSRPVLANGLPLDEDGHGGVCPTHPPWRSERLKEIERIVKTFGGSDGIDGIWLDFIRYPGFWEKPDPSIPDTCYCPRCLARFQADSKIRIPDGLSTMEAAAWIKKNTRYAWMAWKKEQVNSFVREAKGIIETENRRNRGPEAAGSKIILGAFVVPWTKGERRNEISYRLGQDAFQLSQVVDVLSPMLYHRMCGLQPSWVGKMTEYYLERARTEVWPIVQSNIDPVEFKNVLGQVANADAGGVLIFSYSSWKGQPAHGEALADLKFPINLIRNPTFSVLKENQFPDGWFPEKGSHVRSELPCKLVSGSDLAGKNHFLHQQNFIAAGTNGIESWRTDILPCEAGREYLFSAFFFRRTWEDGIYPSIKVWGQEVLLNRHWLPGKIQPLRTRIKCPEKRGDLAFRFINPHPDRTFWMGNPRLIPSTRASHPLGEAPPFFDSRSFPIGVYGARIDNLEHIKRLAVNTVLISGEGEALRRTIQECHRIGLRYVITVPRDPDRLPVFLDEIERTVRQNDLAFYVNDEPELVSFSRGQAHDVNRLLKERFPNAPTCMALVRPDACRDYLDSADFFMMDQYPVPYMPMTWLSDSMDQTSMITGRNRLISIVQAFGGDPGDGAEWPRLPTAEEMNCLAFLSIVHGSRAIFFFNYPSIVRTEQGRNDLGLVVGRLNQIYPWLVEKNLELTIPVTMISQYGRDPAGRPAVQAVAKAKGEERMIIAVNTIGTYVQAEITLGRLKTEKGPPSVRDIFTGRIYTAKNCVISPEFKPYEVKAFTWNER